MEQLLKPVDHTSSPPFLYKRGGDKYYTCDDYDKLGELLGDATYNGEAQEKEEILYVDWTGTPTHPLALDFVFGPDTDDEAKLRHFDLVVIDPLQKHLSPLSEATIVLAICADSLHVHVLGVSLSHDDYVHLCGALGETCKKEGVRLDCPSGFPLPSRRCVPVRLMRVQFELYREEGGLWQSRRVHTVEFPSEKASVGEAFRGIVDHVGRWKEVAARGAMPVPGIAETKRLYFPTRIVSATESAVARFKSTLNGREYAIEKENALVADGEPFDCFEFLRKNAAQLDDFQAPDNRALVAWYDRFRKHVVGKEGVDLMLRKMCPHLRDFADPLDKVRAAHPLPVKYALSNISGKDESSAVPEEANGLTFATVLYLAYRVSGSSFLTHVAKGFDWILAATNDVEEVREHLRLFQRRAFPVAKSLEKKYYVWNPFNSNWMTLDDPEKGIRQSLREIADVIKLFEGYSDMPLSVREELKDNGWIEPLVEEILAQAEVSGNEMTGLPEVYGENVPEYYFFETKFKI